MAAEDLAALALSGILLFFSVFVSAVAVLIYRGLRVLGEPLVRTRMFMKAAALERSWLALIVSFLIFVGISVPEAFALPIAPWLRSLLIGVHLALIAYAFLLFYFVVRPEKSLLEKMEARGGP